MPSINAALVPTIPPGSLFNRFIEDTKLNIRWLTPVDPCYYEVLNRPIVDVVLRQLILAKTVDQISNSMGYLSLFPFVNQPIIENGSQVANIPIRIFWDMHVSLPAKWINVRLARVDRISGSNSGSGSETEYTGTLRFIFSGNEMTDGSESTVETVLFYADYEIDSTLTYQIARVSPANTGILGFSSTLATNEANTIGGSIIFKTADTADADVSAFLEIVPPGISAQYWVTSSSGADTDDDFSRVGMSHGMGLLAASAYNGIVTLESDPLNWIDAFNYPFDLDVDRTSLDGGVVIPQGLFTEFNITAPAGDLPTGETSGTSAGQYYPVYISKLERDGDDLIFTFATYNTTDSPGSDPIEFATLTLTRSMTGGQIIAIEPNTELAIIGDDRTGKTVAELALWTQHFGRGHVKLSRIWDVSGGQVDALWDSLPEILNGINLVTFSIAHTRISSYAISRVPKFVPTQGQWQALQGTLGSPSAANKYVTESDEGQGAAIDLEAQSGITANTAISRYGYTGTRVHKSVKLVVDSAKVSSSSTFYDDEILPRLVLLLGREPVFGDEWYNGTRFLKFNGDAWVG